MEAEATQAEATQEGKAASRSLLKDISSQASEWESEWMGPYGRSWLTLCSDAAAEAMDRPKALLLCSTPLLRAHLKATAAVDTEEATMVAVGVEDLLLPTPTCRSTTTCLKVRRCMATSSTSA